MVIRGSKLRASGEGGPAAPGAHLASLDSPGLVPIHSRPPEWLPRLAPPRSAEPTPDLQPRRELWRRPRPLSHPSRTPVRTFGCRLGPAYFLNNPASRKAPGILVGLEEARSVGLLSAPEIFGDLGIEWHPGRAAVEQRGLSLRTKTFPGSVQAANPQLSHIHLSRLAADPKERPKRVLQGTGHLSVGVALAVGGVTPGA